MNIYLHCRKQLHNANPRFGFNNRTVRMLEAETSDNTKPEHLPNPKTFKIKQASDLKRLNLCLTTKIAPSQRKAIFPGHQTIVLEVYRAGRGRKAIANVAL